MKLIKAIVRPSRVDAIQEGLAKRGIPGITVTEVRGHGRQRGHTTIYRGREYDVSLLPKTKIEVVVADEAVEAAVEGHYGRCPHRRDRRRPGLRAAGRAELGHPHRRGGHRLRARIRHGAAPTAPRPISGRWTLDADRIPRRRAEGHLPGGRPVPGGGGPLSRRVRRARRRRRRRAASAARRRSRQPSLPGEPRPPAVRRDRDGPRPRRRRRRVLPVRRHAHAEGVVHRHPARGSACPQHPDADSGDLPVPQRDPHPQPRLPALAARRARRGAAPTGTPTTKRSPG